MSVETPNSIYEGFVLFEPTEFAGFQENYCRLEKDKTNSYYLVRESSPLIIDEDQMPSRQGWPSELEDADEYHHWLHEFAGSEEKITVNLASILLNNIKLDEPSTHIVGNENLGYALLPHQASLDLYRFNALVIDAENIYDLKNQRLTPIEQSKAEEDRTYISVIIFSRMLAKTSWDTNLAINVCKLIPQSTAAYLAAHIQNARLSNFKDGINTAFICADRSATVTHTENNTLNIRFETVWESLCLDNPEKTPKYFVKSTIEFILYRAQLEKRIVDTAYNTMWTSKFYHSLQEAMQHQFPYNHALTDIVEWIKV